MADEGISGHYKKSFGTFEVTFPSGHLFTVLAALAAEISIVSCCMFFPDGEGREPGVPDSPSGDLTSWHALL